VESEFRRAREEWAYDFLSCFIFGLRLSAASSGSPGAVAETAALGSGKASAEGTDQQ